MPAYKPTDDELQKLAAMGKLPAGLGGAPQPAAQPQPPVPRPATADPLDTEIEQRLTRPSAIEQAAAARLQQMAAQGQSIASNPVLDFVMKQRRGEAAGGAAGGDDSVRGLLTPKRPKAPLARASKQPRRGGERTAAERRAAADALLEQGKRQAQMRESIQSKIRYSVGPDGKPILGTSAGLITPDQLGIQTPPGQIALGIHPDDLTTEEMEWLIAQREAQMKARGETNG